MPQSDATISSSPTLPLSRIFVICSLVLAVAVAIDLAFFAQGASFKREGGGLETMSALFYVVATGVFFTVTPKLHWRRLWHIPALMIFFAMRELDFDKAFTTSGVLSSNLYRGDSALMTKLIAGSVLFLFLFVLYRVARCGGPAAWRGLQSRAPWAFFALAAACCVVVTKSLDGLARKMLAFDVVVSEPIHQLSMIIEEVGEAFIPVFVILAIFARWKGRAI